MVNWDAYPSKDREAIKARARKIASKMPKAACNCGFLPWSNEVKAHSDICHMLMSIYGTWEVAVTRAAKELNATQIMS